MGISHALTMGCPPVDGAETTYNGLGRPQGLTALGHNLCDLNREAQKPSREQIGEQKPMLQQQGKIQLHLGTVMGDVAAPVSSFAGLDQPH